MSRAEVLHGGRTVTVDLLETDHKGRPWEGIGYRAAELREFGRVTRGRVHWLGGRWCFEATGPRT